MAADREVQALAEGRTPAQEAKRQWRALVSQRRVMRAYQQLFLRNGELTEAGAVVLADLARAASLGKVRPGGTAEEMNFREGRRAVFLHVSQKLDVRALERLAKRMRETSSHE